MKKDLGYATRASESMASGRDAHMQLIYWVNTQQEEERHLRGRPGWTAEFTAARLDRERETGIGMDMD